MDENQEKEWLEAQKIEISGDLVDVAKQHLRFLAAVDRRRSLYDGPVLDWAILRYKTCWLPLLAKHNESGVLKGSLVVPLDCEWIWHCHRLNPVQYKKDCVEFYGRILDQQNVESSLRGAYKHQAEEIWTKLYPEEPFDLDISRPFSYRMADKDTGAGETITYDLVSAVKRQSTFYYQVSRPSMHDDRMLEDAVARYKGFLHLIKRNQERSMKRFCVPTYDIDLMWHSHQLLPLSYCKDMVELLGKVLEHDDTDSNRSKGQKLDVGFSETTKQWQDTYGLRYWKAGAMYRGSVPSPLMVTTQYPHPSDLASKNLTLPDKSREFLHLPQTEVVEALLEIVGVKNLPASEKGSLFVTFSKKQPDKFFSGNCRLGISSESGEKLVAGFKCEPSGELVFALMSTSTSKTAITRSSKTIGTTSISLPNLVHPDSKLSIEKWVEMKPVSRNTDLKPVCIHVAVSFTVPVRAPLVLRMIKARPISMSTCIFPLPGKFQQARSWTRFVDDNGEEIVSLQMRDLKATEGKGHCDSKQQVVGVASFSRKPCLLAEYVENNWFLKDYDFSLHIERKYSKDGHIFELRGDRQIKAFYGKRLEYERTCLKEQNEIGFITVVEFSPVHPYGKALALFDMKSSSIEVNEEWFTLPGTVLAFILSYKLKKEGSAALAPSTMEIVTEINNTDAEAERQSSKPKFSNIRASANEAAVTETGNTTETVKSSGCGSGCGGGCGAKTTASGGCGSGCGGCGANIVSINTVASGGGCGGCGGGCGAKTTASGGCGSGCGGCGANIVSINTVASGGGCGGCGGGCGGTGFAVSEVAPVGA